MGAFVLDYNCILYYYYYYINYVFCLKEKVNNAIPPKAKPQVSTTIKMFRRM